MKKLIFLLKSLIRPASGGQVTPRDHSDDIMIQLSPGGPVHIDPAMRAAVGDDLIREMNRMERRAPRRW